LIFFKIVKKIKVLVRRNLPSEKKKLKALKLEEEKRKYKINFLLNEISQGDVLHVMNGPFQGMKYIATANGSQLLPKILGSYEEPIHEWVRERVLDGHYETIIDVGCAEGYYAVGFTLKSPKSKIIACDINTSALTNARQLATINKVNHRIEFSERFDAAVISSEFETEKREKILIFMDVEGAELDLLDTKKNKSLLSCDILVELHDCFIPDLTSKVIGFFSETHKIEIIVDYPWREGEYNKAEYSLSEEDLSFCLDERRPKEMRWMFAKKK
jgi:hypothetical protein